jgi:hypothetical protein
VNSIATLRRNLIVGLVGTLVSAVLRPRLEGRGSVGPGKQVVDLALSVAFDDAVDDVGEVARRLDGV